MTAPEPTPVVLLPSGTVAYKMPAWWREIGPDGKDYGNLPVLPKGAVRMVSAPQPDPDIRAQAIEVLARLHGCAEWDETQHDATAKRGQHAAIVRDIDALAEAGLLPTEVEERTSRTWGQTEPVSRRRRYVTEWREVQR